MIINSKPTQLVKVDVYIKELKENKVLTTLYGDMILRNFAYLQMVLFGKSTYLVDTAGDTVLVDPTMLKALGTTLLAIGTGTKSPSPSDYKLENEIAEEPATLEFTETSTDYRIRAKAIFVPMFDTYVYEIGLIVPIGAYKFLIARDTFAGILIRAYTEYEVGYEITILK